MVGLLINYRLVVFGTFLNAGRHNSTVLFFALSWLEEVCSLSLGISDKEISVIALADSSRYL